MAKKHALVHELVGYRDSTPVWLYQGYVHATVSAGHKSHTVASFYLDEHGDSFARLAERTASFLVDGNPIDRAVYLACRTVL